jgi:hypothetical protein
VLLVSTSPGFGNAALRKPVMVDGIATPSGGGGLCRWGCAGCDVV